MSFDAVAWAMKQPVKDGHTKLVLLSLAQYANVENTSWPKHGTIAEQAMISVSTVQRRLKWLAEEGYLTIEKRVGTSCRYVLNLGQADRGGSVTVTEGVGQADRQNNVNELRGVSEETPLRAARKIDPLWDAIVTAAKRNPETKSERGKWNRGLAELRAVGVSEQEIPAICRNFLKQMPMMDLNPMSISTNLSKLRPSRGRPVPADLDAAAMAAADARRNTMIEEALRDAELSRGRPDQELPTVGVAAGMRELRGRRPGGGGLLEGAIPAGVGASDPPARDGPVPLLFEGLSDRVGGGQEGPLGFGRLLARPGGSGIPIAPLEAKPASASGREPAPDERAA